MAIVSHSISMVRHELRCHWRHFFHLFLIISASLFWHTHFVFWSNVFLCTILTCTGAPTDVLLTGWTSITLLLGLLPLFYLYFQFTTPTSLLLWWSFIVICVLLLLSSTCQERLPMKCTDYICIHTAISDIREPRLYLTESSWRGGAAYLREKYAYRCRLPLHGG